MWQRRAVTLWAWIRWLVFTRQDNWKKVEETKKSDRRCSLRIYWGHWLKVIVKTSTSPRVHSTVGYSDSRNGFLVSFAGNSLRALWLSFNQSDCPDCPGQNADLLRITRRDTKSLFFAKSASVQFVRASVFPWHSRTWTRERAADSERQAERLKPQKERDIYVSTQRSLSSNRNSLHIHYVLLIFHRLSCLVGLEIVMAVSVHIGSVNKETARSKAVWKEVEGSESPKLSVLDA